MPPPRPIRDPETYAIIVAAMEVHGHLGGGIPRSRLSGGARTRADHTPDPRTGQKCPLRLRFKGQALATGYPADFVCYGGIIVELKALRALAGPDEAQLLNYLKASGFSRGLLLNFGSPRLEYRRFVWSAAMSEGPQLRARTVVDRSRPPS